MAKFRFPGVFPFATSQGDIFFGRETELDKLFTQLMTSKTLALHGNSGSGKSSLINAGLIPQIAKRDPEFIPVTIRFAGLKKTGDKSVNLQDEGDNALINEVIRMIRPLIPADKADIPYLLKREEDLWYWAKLLQNHSFPEKNCAFLFIFDQFENIESYKYSQIREFKKRLAQLFSASIPKDYFDYFRRHSPAFSDDPSLAVDKVKREQYNRDSAFIKQPLNTKALFAVREDKYGTLSLLSDYLPDIMKKEFKLSLLDPENARLAIEEPARKKGDFETPPFEFKEATLAYILENLTDPDEQKVDPIEIQIICQHVERKFKKDYEEKKIASDPTTGKFCIDKDYLPPINDIVTHFYYDSWSKAREGKKLSDSTFDALRKEIIDELVVSGKRIPVYKAVFSQQGLILIEALLGQGLVRKTLIDGNDFYQLCHDRFVQPLLEDKNKLKAGEEALENAKLERTALEKQLDEARKEKERIENERKLQLAEENERLAVERSIANKKRVRVLSSLTFLLLFFACLSFYLSRKSAEKERKANEEKYLTTTKIIKKTNPTLSYEIARKWSDNNTHSQQFDAFLSEFDSSRYSYLVGAYSHVNSIVSARYTVGNQLITADNYYTYLWNDKGMLTNNVFMNGVILKSLQIGDQYYYVVFVGDSVEIKDEKGITVNKFPGREDGNNITVSRDGKYILIDDYLYDYRTRQFLDSLPDIPKSQDQMTSVFLPDNTHIAVGYWSGQIFIFSINKKLSENRLKPIKYLPFHHRNMVITSIAIDKSGRFLAAGNREFSVDVWDLGKLNDSISLTSPDFEESEPLHTLKGHSNNVTCVAISPDGQKILSSSDDYTAIIWDLTTGKKLSILKGRDYKVKYVNFCDDGNTMMTGTGDGRVYLWKRDNASDLYIQKKLADFCPFDYYVLSLPQYNVGKAYDTSNILKLFTATLNYLSNIPARNTSPEDPEYLKSLQISLAEVKELYRSLLNNKYFRDSISMPNKRLIYNYYNFLVLKEPELLLLTEREDKQSRFARYAQHHFEDTRDRLLLDTMDIQDAMVYANDFTVNMAEYYLDSTNNYDLAFRYIQFARDSILSPFSIKYPNNSTLKDEELSANVELIRYYL